MIKGIVLKGTRGTRIEDCKFINLDVAVEAENSEKLKLSRNQMINLKTDNQKEKPKK